MINAEIVFRHSIAGTDFALSCRIRADTDFAHSCKSLASTDVALSCRIRARMDCAHSVRILAGTWQKHCQKQLIICQFKTIFRTAMVIVKTCKTTLLH